MPTGPTGPPPSRYRVIERNGRLEVTDTWAGRHPSPPRTHEAAPAEHFADLVIEDVEPTPASAPIPATEPRPDFAPADDLAWSAPPRADSYATPDFLSAVAAALTSEERDEKDRPIFITPKLFDSKAPRRIALDPEGQRELGRAALIVLAVVASAVVFTLTVGWVGFVVMFFAVAFSGLGKPITTAWFDRLEARSR